MGHINTNAFPDHKSPLASIKWPKTHSHISTGEKHRMEEARHPEAHPMIAELNFRKLSISHIDKLAIQGNI